MKHRLGWLAEVAREVIGDVVGDECAGAVCSEIEQRWSERQRHWHGPDHLLQLLAAFSSEAPEAQRILQTAAIWHDAIYDPTRNDNEDRSAELLRNHASDPTSPLVMKAVEIIVASKWSGPSSAPLINRFFEEDTRQLSDECPMSERAEYERAIFREYQFASWAEYRVKRADFLRGWAARFPQHMRGVESCLGLLNSMQPRIAVYPGSFHPFHRGHLSVLRQAEQSFDKVIIAIGINRQKAAAAPQTTETRLQAVRAQLPFHEVVSFDGLLTDYLDGVSEPTTVVRGVRDGTDLEAELRFARFLRDLRPNTNVVWIGCDAELQHVSSSAIRELESISPGAATRYIPTAFDAYATQEQG